MTPNLMKLVPLYREDRGNLKFLGIEAPITYTSPSKMLVIHVKADMAPDQMNMLNKKLRSVFGPDTVVFTTQCEIEFCCLDQVTPEEAKKLVEQGEPAIVENTVIKDKEFIGDCHIVAVVE
jgi:hypothetical protein